MDVNLEENYKKCKYIVKKWEKKFKEQHGRIPSKHDIKEAAKEIRDSYKMYYKLKTSFLENTLGQVLCGDGFNISQNSFNECSFLNGFTKTEALFGLSSIANNKLNQSQCDSIQSNYVELSEVNKQDYIKDMLDNNVLLPVSNTKLLSSSFSRRNPRKNFLKSKDENLSKSISCKISTSQELLPDFEAILMSKLLEKDKIKEEKKSVEFFKISSKEIDKKWFKRSIYNSFCSDDDNDNSSNETTLDNCRNFVISDNNLKNLKSIPIVLKDKKVLETNYDSDSEISNSEDDSNMNTKKKRRINNTFNKGLKKASETKIESITQKNDSDKSNIDSNEKINNSIVKIESKNEIEKFKNNRIIRNSRKDLKSFVVRDCCSTSKRDCSSNGKKLEKDKKISFNYTTNIEGEENEHNLYLEGEDLTSLTKVGSEKISEAEVDVQHYINANKTTAISSNSIKTNMSTNALKKKNLEKKMITGKLNENFVTVDMKKKIFVRGKKTFNLSRYKKKLWKKKNDSIHTVFKTNVAACSDKNLKCFKCDKDGHFAQHCNKRCDELLPYDALMEKNNYSSFLTLEEAEHIKNVKQNYREKIENFNFNKVYIRHEIPNDFLEKCGLFQNYFNNDIKPLYSLNSDGSLKSVPNEVLEVLRMFGYTSFRKDQDKAIMRVLSGLSTLVTLSTGSGKSLCYQLPAYLYSRNRKYLTLVISPLISLMEDQVNSMPNFIRAYCLHTNQTPQQKEKILEKINKREIDILLISPEAIISGEKSSFGFGSILRKLPPIAFVCIDEVHCVSQWSHNFRPSYLMVFKTLYEKLKIRTILGLTATATLSTKNNILQNLFIPDGENGVISDNPLPNNLILSISKDFDRDSALIQFLKSEKFTSFQSIIIYCTRREECERLAQLIRTCFQDKTLGTSKRKRISWCAEAYHAGLTASRRKTIQSAFMTNKLRIIAATIAFGMGINKSDIRVVIHYNMPKTFENYVQEIGRAGRDGKMSYCHLFLDSKGTDQNELKRHIYFNSFDRHVVRKLLQKVFLPCSCNKSEKKRNCLGHEVGFSIQDTVQDLDITEENILTLLCYLELDKKWNVQVLTNAYVTCKIISYEGPQYLQQAAKESPPLAYAIALQIKNGNFYQDKNIIDFPIIDVSSAIGWNSRVVKCQLKNLEWIKGDNELPKRSKLSVMFSDLGFRVKAPGNLTHEELDEVLDVLYNRSMKQEQIELFQLQLVCNSLSSVAFDSYISCTESDVINRSNDLKCIIRKYFQNDYLKEDFEIENTKIDTSEDDIIVNDVINMIKMYPENKFTGRVLAKIFQGIQTPNYPALIWSRCKYWRSHINSDFNYLVKLINSVIIKTKI